MKSHGHQAVSEAIPSDVEDRLRGRAGRLWSDPVRAATSASSSTPLRPTPSTASPRTPGWPDPWVAPDGTEFHFSPTVTLTGADLQDGTVIVVARPSG
jgi:hypothetical protein